MSKSKKNQEIFMVHEIQELSKSSATARLKNYKHDDKNHFHES